MTNESYYKYLADPSAPVPSKPPLVALEGEQAAAFIDDLINDRADFDDLLERFGLTEKQVKSDAKELEDENIDDHFIGPVYFGLPLLAQPDRKD